MLFEFNRYSSLLLIFFVHGLVYAFLLFRKSYLHDTRSDKWLGFFLLLCILYITPWMVGFAGWYDTQPYRDFLFYFPFQHLFWIGPVMFCYVQSLLNPSFYFGGRQWLHFLPGILYLLFSIVMVITDKWVVNDYYFLANGEDPDFDRWYQLTGYASMLFYFFLSLRYYRLYRRLMVQVISYASGVWFRWIRNFLVTFLLMLSVRLIFFITGLFTDLGYWDSWWYFLLFAILFYYIAITGYANSVETKIAYRTIVPFRSILLLPETPVPEGDSVTGETLVLALDAPAPGDEAEPGLGAWKQKLEVLMETERLYDNPELTLTQVAKKVNSNPSWVSMVINKGFGANFNDFVNRYRVEAVIALVRRGEHKRQTLLSIAFECGFNSKATFNRAFKKVTGQNPRTFIQSMIP